MTSPIAACPTGGTPVGARGARSGVGYGFALVTALVALAVMSLAGAALVRAVDTATAVTGSLALREASIPPANAAIEAAIAALADGGGIGNREADVPAQNYRAARQPGEDARGVPWVLQEVARWPADAHVLDGGDGNVLRYVVERVCVRPGPATAQNCALVRPSPPAATGPDAAPVPFFRITVRVDGPQNTVSHVQAMVKDGTPPRRLSWRIVGE